MKYNFSKYSDSELLRLIGEGKKAKDDAFNELYNRYSKKIYFYCKKILGNEQQAEDVFHDVFINVVKSAGNRNIVNNVPGYLFKIARNLCLNVQRTVKPELISIDEISENELYDRKQDDLEDLISSAIELLPHDQRESFVMQMYLGMTYNEIAITLEVPVSTVRNRIVRAKVRMKEILSPFFEKRNVNSL